MASGRFVVCQVVKELRVIAVEVAYHLAAITAAEFDQGAPRALADDPPEAAGRLPSLEVFKSGHVHPVSLLPGASI